MSWSGWLYCTPSHGRFQVLRFQVLVSSESSEHRVLRRNLSIDECAVLFVQKLLYIDCTLPAARLYSVSLSPRAPSSRSSERDLAVDCDPRGSAEARHTIDRLRTVVGVKVSGNLGLHAVTVRYSRQGSALPSRSETRLRVQSSFSLLYRSSSRVSVVYSVF